MLTYTKTFSSEHLFAYSIVEHVDDVISSLDRNKNTLESTTSEHDQYDSRPIRLVHKCLLVLCAGTIQSLLEAINYLALYSFLSFPMILKDTQS